MIANVAAPAGSLVLVACRWLRGLRGISGFSGSSGQGARLLSGLAGLYDLRFSIYIPASPSTWRAKPRTEAVTRR